MPGFSERKAAVDALVRRATTYVRTLETDIEDYAREFRRPGDTLSSLLSDAAGYLGYARLYKSQAHMPHLRKLFDYGNPVDDSEEWTEHYITANFWAATSGAEILAGRAALALVNVGHPPGLCAKAFRTLCGRKPDPVLRRAATLIEVAGLEKAHGVSENGATHPPGAADPDNFPHHGEKAAQAVAIEDNPGEREAQDLEKIARRLKKRPLPTPVPKEMFGHYLAGIVYGKIFEGDSIAIAFRHMIDLEENPDEVQLPTGLTHRQLAEGAEKIAYQHIERLSLCDGGTSDIKGHVIDCLRVLEERISRTRLILEASIELDRAAADASADNEPGNPLYELETEGA